MREVTDLRVCDGEEGSGVMGASTLSKLQMEQYKEIVNRFGGAPSITLSDRDAIRMGETLAILELLGYIRRIDVSGGVVLTKLGEFSDFDAWHKDKVREERRLSSREWRIAIISALIGLIPFIVTTVIPWCVSTVTKYAN